MTDHRVELTDPALRAFWTERHLCTVSTLRPDGDVHVTPMGIALDPDRGLAWGITSGLNVKARNLRLNPHIAICQLDGRWWSTLSGSATLSDDPEIVAEAERRYAERYKVPRVNPDRVAVRVEIHRVLANLPR